MLVGRGGGDELTGAVVDVMVALARAVDAIGPVQAGVEPLRRVRRRHLLRQHVAQLVGKRLGVRFGVEIAALPAPIGPGAGEAVEDLLRRHLGAEALGLRKLGEGRIVGDVAPQERGNVILLDLAQARRHAGLAEVFLGDDVGGDLAPRRRDLDAVEGEHHGAVGIADLALRRAKFDSRVRRLTGGRETAFEAHSGPRRCTVSSPIGTMDRFP